MAIATAEGRFNRTADGGGDWWSQNQPPASAAPGGAPAAGGGGYTFDPSKASDPNEIRAFINDRVQATKGRPATDEDYNYWLPKIQSAGGLGDGKYWMSRMTDPEGTGSNAGGGGGGGGFGGADVMAQDPGYQFALQQGIDAVQHGAAAKGTLLTGGALKDIAAYSGGLAANRYNDIFNRNLSLADLGLRAAGAQGSLGTSYGQQAGQDLSGYGNAAAAGSVNQGNIFGGLLNNIGGLLMKKPSV